MLIRNYTVALLSLLAIAVLAVQTFGGVHTTRLTLGGIIIMVCAFRIVNERSYKVACGICIAILIVRGFIL